MANPLWPLSLPQDAFIGQTFQRRPAFSQFTVDAGPAKRRRVFGNASTDVQSPMFFTSDQLVDFTEFFEETLQEGSLEFDWRHPITGQLATFRFSEYPSFSKLETSVGKLYQCTLNLELLP